MTNKHARTWLDNVVLVDDDGIAAWHSNQQTASIDWSEIETVSIAVDPNVSGPRPCVAFWMIAGGEKSLRLPLTGKHGLDLLNLKLVVLPGFDLSALRMALDAEAACEGGGFVCWKRSK
jgi:hypothetical protein